MAQSLLHILDKIIPKIDQHGNLLSSELCRIPEVIDLRIDKYELLLNELHNKGVVIVESQYDAEHVIATMRKNSTALVVKFADGINLCRSNGVETFLAAIEKIGVNRVKLLGLRYNGISLVSEFKGGKYEANQKPCQGQFVYCFTDNKGKKKCLDDISAALGYEIVTEIVDLTKTDSIPELQKMLSSNISETKNADVRLKSPELVRQVIQVQFCNGMLISSEDGMEVLASTISYIGVSRVKSLRLAYNGIPLLTWFKGRSDEYLQKPLDKYYLYSFADAIGVKNCLLKISKLLNLNLKICMTEKFQTLETPVQKRPIKSDVIERSNGTEGLDNYLVCFDCGHVIINADPKRTFIDVFRRVGLKHVANKFVQYYGTPIVSSVEIEKPDPALFTTTRLEGYFINTPQNIAVQKQVINNLTNNVLLIDL